MSDVVKPVLGVGSVIETEDGNLKVVAIKAKAMISPLGYRRLTPTVVVENNHGDAFDVDGAVFESLIK